MKKRYLITASAFDRKGNLIASKQNNYLRTHPLMKHFATLSGEIHKESLHAEITTLIACKDKQVHTLVVMRQDARGNLKLAKPCKTCQVAINAYNVKQVIYSTEEGMKELF